MRNALCAISLLFLSAQIQASDVLTWSFDDAGAILVDYPLGTWYRNPAIAHQAPLYERGWQPTPVESGPGLLLSLFLNGGQDVASQVDGGRYASKLWGDTDQATILAHLQPNDGLPADRQPLDQLVAIRLAQLRNIDAALPQLRALATTTDRPFLASAARQALATIDPEAGITPPDLPSAADSLALIPAELPIVACITNQPDLAPADIAALLRHLGSSQANITMYLSGGAIDPAMLVSSISGLDQAGMWPMELARAIGNLRLDRLSLGMETPQRWIAVIDGAFTGEQAHRLCDHYQASPPDEDGRRQLGPASLTIADNRLIISTLSDLPPADMSLANDHELVATIDASTVFARLRSTGTGDSMIPPVITELSLCITSSADSTTMTCLLQAPDPTHPVLAGIFSFLDLEELPPQTTPGPLGAMQSISVWGISNMRMILSEAWPQRDWTNTDTGYRLELSWQRSLLPLLATACAFNQNWLPFFEQHMPADLEQLLVKP